MKKFVVVLAAAILCLAAFASVPTQSQGNSKLHRKANKIENNYIVVLDDAVVGEKGPYSIASYVAQDMAAHYRGKLKHIYQNALNGFAIEMSEADAESLSQDYRVKFVEEDGPVKANTTQNNPPWGLDRIDQRDLPLNAQYTYTPTGAGVHVYIIDTGIRRTHTQFGGRAVIGFDSIGDGQKHTTVTDMEHTCPVPLVVRLMELQRV
jgi:subtilisin family serine protease